MSKKYNSLGDRMKLLEGQETDRRLVYGLPVLARLDGRAFHTFCKNLERPFDQRMVDSMAGTTRYLVEETNALIGYTQSDEITLVWFDKEPSMGKVFFSGRVQKMVSSLASLASVEFNSQIRTNLPGKVKLAPTFDCRVWSVPSTTEACNALLWREQDATKNSVSMAAQSVFSPKELMGKNTQDKLVMLEEKGIVWGNYPSSFKRGTYIARRKVLTKFSSQELERLPAKHAARANPGLVVERNVVKILTLPPFGTLVNPDAVVFVGDEPKTSWDDYS